MIKGSSTAYFEIDSENDSATLDRLRAKIEAISVILETDTNIEEVS